MDEMKYEKAKKMVGGQEYVGKIQEHDIGVGHPELGMRWFPLQQKM